MSAGIRSYLAQKMTNTPTRLIAIGDVHGCAHALEALIDAIDPGEGDQLVFLGDLIDQGPESREVLEQIILLKQRCSVVLIQGNHEEMLYAATENEKALRFWEECGGMRTLNSYHFGGGLKDIPPEHWKLLEECRPYYETDDHIFTHANYQPDLPMESQPGYQLRWAILEPEMMRPHMSGKCVLLGHTEQLQGDILDLDFVKCIDTACWRYGWLTAIDVLTNQIWQASRWGILREVDEPVHHGRLTEILRKGKAVSVS